MSATAKPPIGTETSGAHSLHRRVRSSEAEMERRVQEYAAKHCADGTGACLGCKHRQSAAFFGNPEQDDWCYLAEGNLRQSRVDMCPALHTPNARGQAQRAERAR